MQKRGSCHGGLQVSVNQNPELIFRVFYVVVLYGFFILNNTNGE